MKNRTLSAMVALCLVAGVGNTGCNTDLTALVQELGNFDFSGLLGAVGQVQSVDPRGPDFMVPGNRQVNIAPGAEFITDFESQLGPDSFEDSVLIGFENASDADMFIEFSVGDMPQSLFVFDGEAIFFEFECATSVSVTKIETFDPMTFDLLDEQEFTDTTFEADTDFVCGDVLFLEYDGTDLTQVDDLDIFMPPPPPPPGGGGTDPFGFFGPFGPVDPNDMDGDGMDDFDDEDDFDDDDDDGMDF